ncbi:MAG: RNA polymerase sigma factor [Planctomycetota bacterium]|nr:RNA polymerase sigma factor [Planctomycetota bacterium]
MSEPAEPIRACFTDGDLLRAFADHRQQAAFEDIVRRHGGMVLAVCRSVLGNTPDAEDAAQAVFLTLAEQARSLESRATVAGWLHRVAWYVSTRAAQARAIRHRHETEAARMKPISTERHEDSVAVDLLHAGLAELPEKYRVPVLLCHLEGRSHEEAAVLLGCKLSTLSMRLTRGREMLRARLARRGLAVSAAGVASALGASASASAPAAFVTLTSSTAAAALSGTIASTTTISGQMLALSKGAINMLFWAKMKAAAVIMAAVLLAGGGAAGTYMAVAGAKGDAKAAGKDAAIQGTSIRATVVSLDADKLALTVRTGDKTQGIVEQAYAISPDCQITLVAGKNKGPQPEGKLADLTPGTPVTLQLGDDGKTILAIAVQGRSGNYIIKSVDASKRTITVTTKGKEGAVEETFVVAEDASISVPAEKGKGPGEQRKMSDLTDGTPVGLQLSPKDIKTVTSITVQPRTISGSVKAVDVQKNTITVTSGEQDETLTLAKDAKIVVENEQGQGEGKLSDLTGMKVMVRLSAIDPKTVTELRLVKGKGSVKPEK